MIARPFRWWHAAAIFAAANVASALPAGFGGDGAFYSRFALPAVAPPDWLFAPVWLALNVTSLVALHRVANAPPSPGRRGFLISEAAGWVLFAAFTSLYFGLKSPVLGAIDTAAGLAVAGLSLALALRIDRAAAMLVALRFAWLALATYVSAWVARNNPDPYFGG